MAAALRPAVTTPVDLNRISEEQLLETRIRDLPVRIEGTWLEGQVHQLHAELEAKGLSFKPRCYLADEWLTPEDEPVIGIPFFLAHPALIRLEKKIMLEAEGETPQWCMKLLRHEAGHALAYAYRLNRKRRWQKVFGRSSQPYENTYRFRPYSKSFVRHLDYYYAQYHPDEDFAETFAVWLTPGLDWRKRYTGWKALEKLDYVERLMRELRGHPPPVPSGKPHWQAARLTARLKTYYQRKRRSQVEDYPDFHDPNLKRIFLPRTDAPPKAPPAAEVIERHRKDLIRTLSDWTGERKYIAGDLLKTLLQRCRKLNLTSPERESLTVTRLAAYLTTLLMNYRYTGSYRGGKRK